MMWWISWGRSPSLSRPVLKPGTGKEDELRGGDVGVLFATDPDSLAAATAALASGGFASVPLAVDTTGLRIAITESVEA